MTSAGVAAVVAANNALLLSQAGRTAGGAGGEEVPLALAIGLGALLVACGGALLYVLLELVKEELRWRARKW